MQIWYRVKDLELAERFYVDLLGFKELYKDENDRWMRLARDGVEVHSPRAMWQSRTRTPRWRSRSTT